MDAFKLLVLLLITQIVGVSFSTAIAADSYSFGVLSQRSAVLTAQFWNPILDYVQRRTGINLILKVVRTAPESSEFTEKGLYDFVYSNHIFMPKMAGANYQVILRPRNETIAGQIVTLADSPIKELRELDGKEVGFPSQAAFVGYAVPMDQLLRQGIAVTPIFGGNQEGIMGQLKSGRILAVGVNNQVMKAFAARENVAYRVLWESKPFHSIPIAVHPRVAKDVVDQVKDTMNGMNDNVEGSRILELTGKAVDLAPPYGFQVSSPADYDDYMDFYRHTLVEDIE